MLARRRWPWIPLCDAASSRPYFLNALTGQTVWQLPADDDNAGVPPSSTTEDAVSVNAAHEAWMEYWQQWQNVQRQAGNLPPAGDGAPQSEPTETTTSQVSEASGAMARNMAVYVEHQQSPSWKQLARPARKQAAVPDASNVGYTQGSEEYNIWYGKYLTDRWDRDRRDDRARATTRCNPFTDSGWTKANFEPEADRPVICIYFAKGCCYLGSECRYLHRVPTAEDAERLDELHDIFGRERFSRHRDDMTGVGVFTEDCRTLFVGDLKVHRVYPNAEEKTEQLIRQQFGLWGELENVKVVRNRNISFVTYCHRPGAEFAKVAMAEQRLLAERDDDQICVRWAHPGRTQTKEKIDEREWEVANKAIMRRLSNLGYTQEDLECYIRWEIQEAERQGLGVRPPVLLGNVHPPTTGVPSAVTSTYPTGRPVEAPDAHQAESLPPPEAMISPAQMAMKDLYPEVKRIVEMTRRRGPVPLAEQPLEEEIDLSQLDSLQVVVPPPSFERGPFEDGGSIGKTIQQGGSSKKRPVILKSSEEERPEKRLLTSSPTADSCSSKR